MCEQHLRSPAAAISGAGILPCRRLQLDEVVHVALIANIRVVVLVEGKRTKSLGKLKYKCV